MQKQYVEKPRKVMAEQYLAATNPDPVGIHRCGLSPSVESGPPHVHLPDGQVWMLEEGEWILASKWAPDVPTGVMTDDEFQDTFGSGPPLAEGG